MRTYILAGVLAAVALTVPAHAATAWTDWTSATNSPTAGSATGTVGGTGVSYSGQLNFSVTNGTTTIWRPASTYVGGTVDTSPDSVGDYLATLGTFTGVNTITFDAPVLNPVFAIWSLGQPGLEASFNFIGATPVLQVGGPNSQYGGASISVSGNTVSGREGNGIVQFNGAVSSISWTNTPENWYAFTVGVNPGTPAVPEPGSVGLALTGLAGIALAARARRRRV